MKVLVLGGGGQVARAVAASAPKNHSVIVKTHKDLDIADERAVRSALGGEFDWIVNGAAYTAVDRAETESGQARKINETAVGILARAAAGAGCRLLHLSTDFVFDGKSNRAYLPTDSTNPLSSYGATKLGGEHQALNQGGDAIVLRTAWVYASTGKNFALTMLRLLRERDEVRVVADQIGTPTWATGIAQAIWGLIDVGAAGGIYHWTDLGIATWYDFATAIQDEALARGLLVRAVPVIPIATDEYPTPAQRPAFSVLDTQATRALVNAPARHWRHNLRMMLNELRTE
ncbi:MAG: dTDP-4-dehydrorhamnose reductase [Acidobacteriota bacterium]|nr:dTDP-4-dehydrorhamnose reductase [Acidobacteriota bacterium]